MARYLTPAKIGLLALIELYADEAVPSDAILPVLSFITSHLIDTAPQPPSETWNRATHSTALLLSIHAFEDVLSAHPVLLGMPGRRLWDSFLQKLWSIDSLDSLHSFFSGLRLLLQPAREELRHDEDPDPAAGMRLARTSMFGMFVRRCQLEFERLRFHDAAELWKGFVAYRQPTAAYLRKKNPGFERLRFDNVSLLGEREDPTFEALTMAVYGDSLTGHSTGAVPMSTDDMEGLLEFQVEQMQKYGNRVPLEIRQKLQGLIHDSHLIPSVSHYVNFLDSWRAGDHPNAFDNLHRYFDYTMQNRDRLFYQYALMNLAVLQSEFGCYTEAVDAMLQTVSTARENRDMMCLNFALNWLFHFGRAHPSLVRHIDPASTLGSAKETLAFLRVRAREASMPTLLSTLLLSEAKLTLSNGESVATALENVVRSSHAIIERNSRPLLAAHSLVAASLWDRLGLADLAASTCEVALRAHAPHGVFDDALRLTCRLAAGLADRGRYDDALRLLDALDDGDALRAWKAHQHWRRCRGVVRLRRDLARGDLDAAQDLLSQLLQNKFDDLEPDMAFVVDLLRVDYLVRRGDLSLASSAVEDLLARISGDDTKDVALRVRLLLVKCTLLEKAGRPQRGLSLAARAASIALRARLLPLVYHSVASLSAILVSLSEFDAAASLLRSTLPRALEHRSSSLSGRLYSLLADAEMGAAGAVAGRERTERLTGAAGALDRAFGFYADGGESALARETVAKRGVVMRVLEGGLGGEVAGRYVSLLEQEAGRNGR